MLVFDVATSLLTDRHSYDLGVWFVEPTLTAVVSTVSPVIAFGVVLQAVKDTAEIFGGFPVAEGDEL